MVSLLFPLNLPPSNCFIHNDVLMPKMPSWHPVPCQNIPYVFPFPLGWRGIMVGMVMMRPCTGKIGERLLGTNPDDLGSGLKVKVNSVGLTLILLVAYVTNTKWRKKLKPWHMGTHLIVPSESYPMNTNMTGFRRFLKIIASNKYQHDRV